MCDLQKGATPSKRLVNDATMITDLLTCYRERVSLGQSKYQKLTNHLSGFNELELKSEIKRHVLRLVNLEGGVSFHTGSRLRTPEVD